MSDHLHYGFQEGVATISMDDGKVNVMSLQMLSELGAAVDRAEADNAILVLRSTRPGIFSAGFDLKVFAANDIEGSLKMVKAGAELALRLLTYRFPTVGLMQGHAFPMGAFLLLACDIRIGTKGVHRIGLNEVAIGIAPPAFAIELARSRLVPSYLSRSVTLGEMYGPDEAVLSGFLDRVVPEEAFVPALEAALSALRVIHGPSHAVAKTRLRRATQAAMRSAIDEDLTLAAYAARSQSSAR